MRISYIFKHKSRALYLPTSGASYIYILYIYMDVGYDYIYVKISAHILCIANFFFLFPFFPTAEYQWFWEFTFSVILFAPVGRVQRTPGDHSSCCVVHATNCNGSFSIYICIYGARNTRYWIKGRRCCSVSFEH